MDYVATVTANAGKVYVDGSKLIKYVDGTDDVTLANKAGGTWTLTEDGKALKSVADLLAAYEADKSAQDSLTSAEASLAEAIAAVYGKENGGYADANESGIVWFSSTTVSGKNVYTPDYTQTATIYKTAQDAENGAGEAQVYKLKLADVVAGDSVEFEGVTYTFKPTDGDLSDMSNVAAKLQGDATFGDGWTISTAGGFIVFTATSNSNTVDPDPSVEKRVEGTLALDEVTETTAKGVGAAQVFTASFDAAGALIGDTLVFGDKTFMAGADLTGDALVAAVATDLTGASAGGTTWTVTSDGADDSKVLKFTAGGNDEGYADASTAEAALVITPRTEGTIKLSDNSTTTEGVKAGETLAVSKDAALSKAVVDAKDAIALFDKKVAEFEDARDIKAKIKDFDTDLDTVNKWFSDNGYKTVDLTDSATAKTATKDSDIFFISKMSTDKDAAVINSFGKQGDDYLVAGSKFANLSIVDSTLDITKAKLGGDAAKFDVFAQQSGDNTILYFETNEVAGNVVDTQNYIKVTLNGVTAEDLALSDGFITLA